MFWKENMPQRVEGNWKVKKKGIRYSECEKKGVSSLKRDDFWILHLFLFFVKLAKIFLFNENIFL